MPVAEYVGLLASIIILISFIPKNNLLLTRIINSVGAAIFVIYGIWINAWSVWILNSFCFILNITYIIIYIIKKNKMEKKNDND